MKNYLKFPILIASVLTTFNALSLVNSNSKDAYRTDALSYKTLQTIENKAVIEFENENHNLPEGESASVSYSGSAVSYKNNGQYTNARIFAARFYTGNYSCSPINEEEKTVFLNGEERTRTVNTTGGYVLYFNGGSNSKVSVTYSSSEERYADLYVRVSTNKTSNVTAGAPASYSLSLKNMMTINLNDEDLTINDKATVFGRKYQDHSLDDELGSKNGTADNFALEKGADGNWDTKNTVLNMYGRYIPQDWQTVLVGKVLIKKGNNSFVYSAINGDYSGQLDCMILDYDKYDNKDVYEFENADDLGNAKKIASYSDGKNDALIQDFATYNKDYACSNHDFVKYSYNGNTITFNNVKKNNFTNPHLVMRVSSLLVNQGTYVTTSVQPSKYLEIKINDNAITIDDSLYIEGRNDSANKDPDGISHGIQGSLNWSDYYDSGRGPRYLYLIWRTIDFGPITLNGDVDGVGSNKFEFTTINGAANTEYIGFDYFSIVDVEDDRYAATAFANTYVGLFANTCKPDGNTNVSTLKTVWTSMRSDYNNLTTASQTIILNSSASSVSLDPIERLLERYDYIGGKYNTQLVDDGNWNFFGRTVSATSSYPLPYMSMTNNNYLLLLIIIIGSTLSITAFIVIYKKSKYKRQK